MIKQANFYCTWKKINKRGRAGFTVGSSPPLKRLKRNWLLTHSDFPGGSDGKASAYNAGDPGSIPGLGRSPGEGNGTPLQYSCLENPMDTGAWLATVHGVTESRTRLSDFTFTSHFHALEKEMATHSSILAWEIPWIEKPGGLQSVGSQRVGHDWATSLLTIYVYAKTH